MKQASTTTSRSTGYRLAQHLRVRQPGSGPIRIPIRAKITLPYLLLALMIAIAAAYWVVSNVVADVIQFRFTNQLIDAGRLSSEWMVREENRLLETLRILAQTQGAAQALTSHQAEKLRELSFGITVDQQEEVVLFIDRSGQPVLSMRHRAGGNLEEYAFSQGGQPVDWPFVQKVLAEQADQTGDKFSGHVQEGDSHTFYVAGPIYDDQGELAGAVLVGKTLPTLARQMREATSAHITLYALDGKPLASTHLDQPVPLAANQIGSLLAVKLDASLKRDLGEINQPQPDNIRSLTTSSNSYAEIIGPWVARDKQPIGLAGSSLATSFAVQTSSRTAVGTFLWIGVALVLVIVLGLIVANLITRPIITLMKAFGQVAEGNLEVRVPPTSNDEVGVLAEEFTGMVAALKQSKNDLLKAYEETLEGWARTVEMRDEETGGHTRRVTELTIELARRLGVSVEEQQNLRWGAILHDVGKLGIPDAILMKPGRLTEDEWKIMRTHPCLAEEALREIEFLRPVLAIPASHHEKWDGSGYPRGLMGEAIPLAARIFAIVDVWDAMTSDRVYRKAIPTAEVIRHIRASAGSHFDPHIVEQFLEIIGETPVLELKQQAISAYEHTSVAAD